MVTNLPALDQRGVYETLYSFVDDTYFPGAGSLLDGCTAGAAHSNAADRNDGRAGDRDVSSAYQHAHVAGLTHRHHPANRYAHVAAHAHGDHPPHRNYDPHRGAATDCDR